MKILHQVVISLIKVGRLILIEWRQNNSITVLSKSSRINKESYGRLHNKLPFIEFSNLIKALDKQWLYYPANKSRFPLTLVNLIKSVV